MRLNADSARELELLPGVGEVRARAIVESREEAGPFEKLEDVERVRGVGPATRRGLAAWVDDVE